MADEDPTLEADTQAELRRLKGQREVVESAPTTIPLYVVTMGSVFASAALSILIAEDSRTTLWVMFAIALAAVIGGCFWEFTQRAKRRP